MTEYRKSAQTNYWCEVCRTWVRDSVQGRALHENGSKHKEALERKLREGRRERDKRERMESQAKEAMEKIEKLARDQYQKDLNSFDARRGEVEGRTTQRHRDEASADLEVKKAAERSYRESQSAATSSKDKDVIQDWVYDPNSGYYYSSETGSYYDGHSQMYFHHNEWKKTPPKRNEAAEFERYFETAGDAVAQGEAFGPVARGTVKQATTIGYGVNAKHALPQRNESRQGEAASGSCSLQQSGPPIGRKSRPAVVVRPVKKIVERSNQSIGGYQMPLYCGQVGGARGIGMVVSEPAAATTKDQGRQGTAQAKVKKAGGARASLAAGPAIAKKKGKKAINPEEAKALRAREEARKRVEQRTMSNFGFS
uniref:U1-type domain-containing protein n=1 Tax=Chloropicon primus TaxID=1764295 RepID=A0A7S2SZN0_9CHLO|mmetsp:Transcript_14366/g.40865  ORF Transcript_14366/g.40865 Transcript_14366/m.40865 type:complete len:368 (+) Transcript_14366:450-1553(+)